VGRGLVERRLLAFAIVLAVAGGVVAINRGRVPPTLSEDPVVEYLNALVRHDYRSAYELTDLSADRIPPSTSGLTRAHFEAFERARPLKSWRRVGNDAVLTYESGAGARVNFGVNGDGVHIPVSIMTITSDHGPLPSLSVDRVSVAITPLPGLGKRTVGAFRYRYGLVVIRGKHRFDVGAGAVTRAIAFGRDVRVSGSKVDAVKLTLKLSARGNTAVATALRNMVIGTCPDDLCIVKPCGSGSTQYSLEAGYDLIVRRELIGVSGPAPRNGWAIAITFIDQAQPAVLKGGSERTTTLHARYIFGFVTGSKPKLLDRCWVSSP
jgi:hypothetical protein